MREYLHIADISDKQLHIQMVPVSKKLKAANDGVLLAKKEQPHKPRQSLWKAGLWSTSKAGKRTSPYAFDVVIAEHETSTSMIEL